VFMHYHNLIRINLSAILTKTMLANYHIKKTILYRFNTNCYEYEILFLTFTKNWLNQPKKWWNYSIITEISQCTRRKQAIILLWYMLCGLVYYNNIITCFLFFHVDISVTYFYNIIYFYFSEKVHFM